MIGKSSSLFADWVDKRGCDDCNLQIALCTALRDYGIVIITASDIDDPITITTSDDEQIVNELNGPLPPLSIL